MFPSLLLSLFLCSSISSFSAFPFLPSPFIHAYQSNRTFLINLKGNRHSRDYLPIRRSYHSVLQVKNAPSEHSISYILATIHFLSLDLATHLTFLQISLWFLTSYLPHSLPHFPSTPILTSYLPFLPFICLPSFYPSSTISLIHTFHTPFSHLPHTFSNLPHPFLSPDSHLSLTTHNSQGRVYRGHYEPFSHHRRCTRLRPNSAPSHHTEAAPSKQIITYNMSQHGLHGLLYMAYL